MYTLLLIDDEPSIQHAFRRAFREPAYSLVTAATAAEGVAVFGRARPDVVVLDVRLPDAGGLETFARLRTLDARIPVILITGHGTTDLAIEAMKGGAFDYLLKPLELAELRDLIDRACRSSRLMNVPAEIAGAGPAPPGDALVGRCPAMQEVYKAIGRVASRDVTVLVLGERRDGQGAGRAGRLPALRPGRPAVPGDQLRGDPGEPAGERAVRPREGRLHRRRPQAHRQVRAVLRRDDFSRRGRRHGPADAGEDPAPAPGADLRAPRRQRNGEG